jgi:hypothetical protein
VATGTAYAAVPPEPEAHDAWEYVKLVLDTLLAWNIPLRVEGLAPLMRTGWPACRAGVLLTLAVTTPLLQLRVVI